MNHVMVDLETLGTRPGCVILSVGAVAFDHRAQALGPEFYTVINQKSCEEVGLQVDRGTLAWWMRQSPEAQQVLKESRSGGISLREALGDFRAYIRNFSNDVRIWGNGPSFDNAILAACYASIGAQMPWKYANDRCFRTVKSIIPKLELERQGTYHNALDDAKSQAVHAMKIMKAVSDALARQ